MWRRADRHLMAGWRRLQAPTICLFLLLAGHTQLTAQQVQGRIIDAMSHAAIPGALVELHDSTGRITATRLTSNTGTFLLSAAAPGLHRYRVAAIGFAPLPLTVVAVGDSVVALGDVGLQRFTVRLPDLMAVGNREFCGQNGVDDEVFWQLLASARNALEVIDATVRSGTLGFEVEQVRSQVIYRAVNNFERADTSYLPMASWPIQSIASDSLRAFGFMRETWNAAGEPRRLFYGPDARVLFAAWFVASHCYSLAKVNPASGVIKLLFKPAGKGKQVDISGVMSFDAKTLALQTLEFKHEHLPNWMPDHVAGGEMMFRQLGSGLWITTLWSIWGPIEGVNLDARSEVGGIAETRGRVVRLVRLGGGEVGGGSPK